MQDDSNVSDSQLILQTPFTALNENEPIPAQGADVSNHTEGLGGQGHERREHSVVHFPVKPAAEDLATLRKAQAADDSRMLQRLRADPAASAILDAAGHRDEKTVVMAPVDSTRLDPVSAETSPQDHFYPREAFIQSTMTPQEILTMWNQEKPSETVARRGLFNHLRLRPPTPQVKPFAGHDQLGLWDSIAENVKIAVGPDKQDDVRGWLLKKIMPEHKLKGDLITYAEAQVLISKGLGISRFEAALLDRATRDVPANALDSHFQQALLEPESLADPNVIAFSDMIQALSVAEWTNIVQHHALDQFEIPAASEQYAKSETRKPYVGAIDDLTKAVLRERFREDMPTAIVVGQMRAIAIGLQTRRLTLAQIKSSLGKH